MIAGLYDILNAGTTLVALVGTRISPDVRNRNDAAMPAVAFEISSREYTEHATGSSAPTFGTASINCYALSRVGAEAVADAVIDAINGKSSYPTSDCIIEGRVNDRSATEFFERGGDSELAYVSTVNITLTGLS